MFANGCFSRNYFVSFVFFIPKNKKWLLEASNFCSLLFPYLYSKAINKLMGSHFPVSSLCRNLNKSKLKNMEIEGEEIKPRIMCGHHGKVLYM